jgi:hypothetical protein
VRVQRLSRVTIKPIEHLDALFLIPVEKFEDALGVPLVVACVVGFRFCKEIVVKCAVETCYPRDLRREKGCSVGRAWFVLHRQRPDG